MRICIHGTHEFITFQQIHRRERSKCKQNSGIGEPDEGTDLSSSLKDSNKYLVGPAHAHAPAHAPAHTPEHAPAPAHTPAPAVLQLRLQLHHLKVLLFMFQTEESHVRRKEMMLQKEPLVMIVLNIFRSDL